MCLWFLEHVDQEMTWRNNRALAYRFWHPRDHIHFKRMGGFGAGDRWHIVEAMGADLRFLLDEVFHVTKLDESGFHMEVRKLGGPVAQVVEDWEVTAEGLRWTVRLTIGSTGKVLGPISRFIRPRVMPMLVAWRRHNVEEAGNLPMFLPELYCEHSR